MPTQIVYLTFLPLQDLWIQIEQALRFDPAGYFSKPVSQPGSALVASEEASDDDEKEEAGEQGMEALLRTSRNLLPAYFQHLLKPSVSTGPQLLPSYSETIASHNLCPLQPSDGANASHEPSIPIGSLVPPQGSNRETGLNESVCDADNEAFYDAMESVEADL